MIIVKGQPRNGPPPERTLVLADLDAVPRMARRPTPNNPTPTPLEDEPLAWESRYLQNTLQSRNQKIQLAIAESH